MGTQYLDRFHKAVETGRAYTASTGVITLANGDTAIHLANVSSDHAMWVKKLYFHTNTTSVVSVGTVAHATPAGTTVTPKNLKASGAVPGVSHVVAVGDETNISDITKLIETTLLQAVLHEIDLDEGIYIPPDYAFKIDVAAAGNVSVDVVFYLA